MGFLHDSSHFDAADIVKTTTTRAVTEAAEKEEHHALILEAHLALVREDHLSPLHLAGALDLGPDQEELLNHQKEKALILTIGGTQLIRGTTSQASMPSEEKQLAEALSLHLSPYIAPEMDTTLPPRGHPSKNVFIFRKEPPFMFHRLCVQTRNNDSIIRNGEKPSRSFARRDASVMILNGHMIPWKVIRCLTQICPRRVQMTHISGILLPPKISMMQP